MIKPAYPRKLIASTAVIDGKRSLIGECLSCGAFSPSHLKYCHVCYGMGLCSGCSKPYVLDDIRADLTPTARLAGAGPTRYCRPCGVRPDVSVSDSETNVSDDEIEFKVGQTVALVTDHNPSCLWNENSSCFAGWGYGSRAVIMDNDRKSRVGLTLATSEGLGCKNCIKPI